MSAASRQNNRDRMPTVAAWIDELRESLGEDLSAGMRVIYAKEGDQTIGKPVDDVGVAPVIDWTKVDQKLKDPRTTPSLLKK